MKILSSRRAGNHQNQTTQKLVTFQCQNEWFALPIKLVRKFTPMGHVYGKSSNGIMGLTHFDNQEIPVIDINQLIFGEDDLTHQKSIETFILIVQQKSGEFVGLPIRSQPVLRRVPDSIFTPIPPAYSSRRNLNFVSQIAVLGDNEPSLLLLNLDKLI